MVVVKESDERTVIFHPSTGLTRHPEFCIYNEFVLTSENYIKTITDVKFDWLLELATKTIQRAQRLYSGSSSNNSDNLINNNNINNNNINNNENNNINNNNNNINNINNNKLKDDSEDSTK
ncbi:hypothetical protein ACTFIW_002232 [Dictyostelium discoideum]